MLPVPSEWVVVGEDQIAARVADLGQRISDDYRGRNLVLVGILNGACIFVADLIRSISIHLEVGFVSISSYGQSTESSGDVTIIKGLDRRFDGKHVLLVEDIVDTGLTISASRLADDLLDSGAESVRLCTLLDKPSGRKRDVHPDYIGFRIRNRFVVGYGLDFDGRYRNLRCVAVLHRECPL